MADIETEFIHDCWYVAGWSADFTHALTPLRILDEPIVVFRTESGVPAALEDACPHRKLPLSKGRPSKAREGRRLQRAAFSNLTADEDAEQSCKKL